VPLPWARSGPSYGFGADGAHLPQPTWFGEVSVEAEEADPNSTLALYRAALRARHRLQTEERLTWGPETPDVLHFVRPGGWHSVTNLGTEPVALPAGEVVLTSSPLDGDTLPPDTTAWILAD
jgi:alpha-glucosidase